MKLLKSVFWACFVPWGNKEPPKLTNLTLLEVCTWPCHTFVWLYLHQLVCVLCGCLYFVCLLARVCLFAHVSPYLLSLDNSQVSFSLTPLHGSKGPPNPFLPTIRSLGHKKTEVVDRVGSRQIFLPSTQSLE